MKRGGVRRGYDGKRDNSFLRKDSEGRRRRDKAGGGLIPVTEGED